MQAYIDQEKAPAEIVEMLRQRWPNVADIDKVIYRMLRLLKISEWKRRQAAPGPKLSRRAFGRERRYPISSGYNA